MALVRVWGSLSSAATTIATTADDGDAAAVPPTFAVGSVPVPAPDAVIIIVVAEVGDIIGARSEGNGVPI